MEMTHENGIVIPHSHAAVFKCVRFLLYLEDSHEETISYRLFNDHFKWIILPR